jgi:hypothetical protein
VFGVMFPHSDWTIMTQMISFLLALTQIVVRIVIQEDSWAGVVFVAILKDDTVKLGPIRRVKPSGCERVCRSKDLRLIPFIPQI